MDLFDEPTVVISYTRKTAEYPAIEVEVEMDFDEDSGAITQPYSRGGKGE